jgi:hypothetical protein
MNGAGMAPCPLAATAASQLREAPYDIAELRLLARETAGALPPRAVLWLVDEYAAREREVSALVSECQDRSDENERLRELLKTLRLRIRSIAQRARATDDARDRLEAAARSVR